MKLDGLDSEVPEDVVEEFEFPDVGLIDKALFSEFF